MPTVTRNRSDFMTKHFHNLPVEIQNLIMSKTYRIPRPKFRKGNIVKYSERRQAELRKRLSQLRQGLDVHSYRSLGEQPFDDSLFGVHLASITSVMNGFTNTNMVPGAQAKVRHVNQILWNGRHKED